MEPFTLIILTTNLIAIVWQLGVDFKQGVRMKKLIASVLLSIFIFGCAMDGDRPLKPFVQPLNVQNASNGFAAMVRALKYPIGLSVPIKDRGQQCADLRELILAIATFSEAWDMQKFQTHTVSIAQLHAIAAAANALVQDAETSQRSREFQIHDLKDWKNWWHCFGLRRDVTLFLGGFCSCVVLNMLFSTKSA